ncbi:prolipoprotein diacylglyceryl transferase family protein [Nonomuraea sp. CA-218870]
MADTVAPGIAFGQAIARWGNWFNQAPHPREALDERTRTPRCRVSGL